jgi:pimeloyl-ACP methyl ester carboxylesterase
MVNLHWLRGVAWLALVVLLAGRAAWAAQGAPPPIATSDADNQKFAAFLDFVRNRNAQNYAVTGSRHIDEASYVPIGGIDQWITIRGEDRANPVLLFLHGGPGDVTNPWSYPYFHAWYKSFTVVQWDQRGAGRTLARSGESVAPTMTIERMVQDGIELTEYLRKHLDKQKIILVGHSWGSVFGALMAKTRPDLFYAWVGTGQVADFQQGNRVAYELALHTAEHSGDPIAAAEFRALGPPPFSDGKGWQLLYKWRSVCEGSDRFIGGLVGLALAAPGYSIRDINDWNDGQLLGGRQLFDQGTKLDPRRFAGHFDLPVFVFQGANDCSSPTRLAKSYLESITAPRKEFVTIPGAGHFAVFMKTDVFLHELVTRVRPLAMQGL